MKEWLKTGLSPESPPQVPSHLNSPYEILWGLLVNAVLKCIPGKCAAWGKAKLANVLGVQILQHHGITFHCIAPIPFQLSNYHIICKNIFKQCMLKYNYSPLLLCSLNPKTMDAQKQHTSFFSINGLLGFSQAVRWPRASLIAIYKFALKLTNAPLFTLKYIPKLKRLQFESHQTWMKFLNQEANNHMFV